MASGSNAHGPLAFFTHSHTKDKSMNAKPNTVIRCIIEDIHDGVVIERKEVTVPYDDNKDWSSCEAMGIAVGGAISGMQVWDHSSVAHVVGYMLDPIACNFEDGSQSPFFALGEAYRAWWEACTSTPDFNQCCRVVLDEKYFPRPGFNLCLLDFGKAQFVSFEDTLQKM